MTPRSLALAAVLMAALGGCASTGAAATISLGQPVVLAPGERVALPDATSLRYVGVSDDSRCRPDVHCIWAGDAKVMFEFTPAAASLQRITLNTTAQPATAALGDGRLKLIALSFDATPKATVQVDATR